MSRHAAAFSRASLVVTCGGLAVAVMFWMAARGMLRTSDPFIPAEAAVEASRQAAESGSSAAAAAGAAEGGAARAAGGLIGETRPASPALPRPKEAARSAGDGAELEEATRSGILVPLRPGAKPSAARVDVERLDPPTPREREEQRRAIGALARRLVQEDLAGGGESKDEIAVLAAAAEIAARAAAERHARLGRLDEKQATQVAEDAKRAVYQANAGQRDSLFERAVSKGPKGGGLLVTAPGAGPLTDEHMLTKAPGTGDGPVSERMLTKRPGDGKDETMLVRPPPDAGPPSQPLVRYGPPLHSVAFLTLDQPAAFPAELKWSKPSERMLASMPQPATDGQGLDPSRKRKKEEKEKGETREAPELGGSDSLRPAGECEGCRTGLQAGGGGGAYGVSGSGPARPTGTSLSLRYLGPCAEGHAYEVANATPKYLGPMTLEGGGQSWPLQGLSPGQTASIKSARVLDSLRAKTD